MKRSLLFLLIALVFGISQGSFAQVTQYFTIINKTGMPINKIFVAPVTDSEKWSDNIIGAESLNNDDVKTLFFTKNNFPEDCVWDIKVINNNGNSFIWYDIDFCKYHTITLYWDENKDRGWTEFK